MYTHREIIMVNGQYAIYNRHRWPGKAEVYLDNGDLVEVEEPEEKPMPPFDEGMGAILLGIGALSGATMMGLLWFFAG